MVLRVAFDKFGETVGKFTREKLVSVAKTHGKTSVSAAILDKCILIVARTNESVDDVKLALSKDGMDVIDGEWTSDEVGCGDWGVRDIDVFVASVAYKSREDMPGLWVEAFPFEPNQGEVLRALYEDFEQTGDIENMSFEDFERQAAPNVVVLSPDDLRRFASQRTVNQQVPGTVEPGEPLFPA